MKPLNLETLNTECKQVFGKTADPAAAGSDLVVARPAARSGPGEGTAASSRAVAWAPHRSHRLQTTMEGYRCVLCLAIAKSKLQQTCRIAKRPKGQARLQGLAQHAADTELEVDHEVIR